MGRSLGSAAAAEIYRTPPPGVVRGFIWESGFVDLDALVGRRGFELPRLPEDDQRAFDPIPKLRVGRSALLVLHGADDDMIVPREAHEAFDAAGSSTKKLVFVPDRGHNDVSASPVYWDAIGAFVRATAS